MKTRFIIVVTAVIAVMLGLVSVAPAQAAADITRGGSCSVSANWSIAISVNFNNTVGSPSLGTVDYIVMNSPGSLGAFHVRYFGAVGQVLRGFGSSEMSQYRDVSKPGYVYRVDPSGDNDDVRRVEINPESYTGISCSAYGDPSMIYSAN